MYLKIGLTQQETKRHPLVVDGLHGPKTRHVRKKVALKAKKSGLILAVDSKGALVKY